LSLKQQYILAERNSEFGTEIAVILAEFELLQLLNSVDFDPCPETRSVDLFMFRT